MTPYHTGKVAIGSNYDSNPLKRKYIENDQDMLTLQTALVGDVKQHRRNKLHSRLYAVTVGFILVFAYGFANSQAIYGPQGQYLGYSQTSPSGVTNTYNATGQNTGSYQTDNGQTSFYGPQGGFRGTNTAPVYQVPNTTIGSPRNVPQVRSVGGW